MNSLVELQEIFNAVVLPAIPTASFTEVRERVMKVSEHPSFGIFLNNKAKLISKIPKFKKFSELMGARPKNKPLSYWINAWFDRMVFTDTSELHSIPNELKDITLVVHNIMILYTINNVGVIVHGSFASHLLDHRVRYADIDVTCLQDDLVFLTSLLLYLFLGQTTHILSIPYIINHRQLRADNTTISLTDALRIDSLTATLSQCQPIEIAKGILINTQHPVTQFLNYFKMLHLSSRRGKIRHYKENQKLILSTIYIDMLKRLNISEDQLLKIIPYTVYIDASIDGVIIMKLKYLKLEFKIIFYTECEDVNFFDLLRRKLGISSNHRELIVFNQLGSLFPEQCVEVLEETVDSVLHINMSRNEVYKVITSDELISGESSHITIDSYSQLNMLSIVGLHYFFTRRSKHKTIEPFLRILSTIIHFCNVMEETPYTLLYDRRKNSGYHIRRTIFDSKTYIPRVTNISPIIVYELPANSLEMKVKENCSIEDYHNRYKQ